MKKIKIIKNGPYEVSGRVLLKEEKIVLDRDGFPYEWQEKFEYPRKEKYHLCRCGNSKNKPFCDKKVGESCFDGKESASKVPFEKQAEKIAGPKLILKDATKLCVHAGFCDRAGGIWDLTLKSDNSANQIAVEEAANCPSGRLVVEDAETKKPIEPDFKKSISVTYDSEGFPGPFWVKGGIPVESADGSIYEVRNRVTLCQCGHSQNKPFCDGSHYQYE